MGEFQELERLRVASLPKQVEYPTVAGREIRICVAGSAAQPRFCVFLVTSIEYSQAHAAGFLPQQDLRAAGLAG